MVESQPSKLLVASSILVSRSIFTGCHRERPVRFLTIALVVCTLLAPAVFGQLTAVDQPAPPSRRVVTIEKLNVKGTRFPARSIQILTGLREGDQIDEAAVRKAIERMLESGLIRSVNYNYESLEDPHKVALELDVIDETPLYPASIEIPGVDPEPVWQYLESVDPLFTRELPRTQKALRFYAHAISDFLRTNKRRDDLAPIVRGDAAGRPTGIVFAPPRRPANPQAGSRRTG
jgi:Surface antigen variable number repeat